MADTEAIYSEVQGPSESHQLLNDFWPKTMADIKATKEVSLALKFKYTCINFVSIEIFPCLIFI